jgi:hypothetical protein
LPTNKSVIGRNSWRNAWINTGLSRRGLLKGATRPWCCPTSNSPIYAYLRTIPPLIDPKGAAILDH